MKILKNSYIWLLSGVLLFSSCGKDYLDTKPTNAAPTEDQFKTTTLAFAALQGIHKIMINQLRSSQANSGQGTIYLYNEFLGDQYAYECSNGWFGSEMQWNTSSHAENAAMISYPYFFYFLIIGNANEIIAYIDEAEGPDNEKQYIKAQALAYRGFSYFNLAQFYGDRWGTDSYCVPITTRPTMPDFTGYTRSKTTQVIARAEEDLKVAVELFVTSKYKRSSQSADNEGKSNIDLNVTKGIQARLALYKGEWANASALAKEAREGYKLMSNSAYFEGFSKLSNEEWIWGSRNTTAQNLYFYSFHAYSALNSSASAVRGKPRGISMELYAKIPTTDIRRGLWLYDPTEPINIPGTDPKKRAAQITDKAKIAQVRVDWSITDKSTTIWNYMNRKFIAEAAPGIGDVCHMRAAEMYLIEAEAEARLGNATPAVEALYAVVSPRDAAYTKSTKTGDALIEEIMTYRSIELWGEGHRWFDMKRLSIPLNRNGVASTGNYGDTYAITVPTTDPRWIWGMPRDEKNSNVNLEKYDAPVYEK